MSSETNNTKGVQRVIVQDSTLETDSTVEDDQHQEEHSLDIRSKLHNLPPKMIQKSKSWFNSLAELTPAQIRSKFASEFGKYSVFLIMFTISTPYNDTAHALVTAVPRDDRHSFLLTDQMTGRL